MFLRCSRVEDHVIVLAREDLSDSDLPTERRRHVHRAHHGEREQRVFDAHRGRTALADGRHDVVVLAAVRLLWSYSTLAGTKVASAQPATALRGVPTYQLFSLHISHVGQDWLVAHFSSPVIYSYTDPLCSQAVQDTTELVNTLTTNNQSVAIKLWSDQQTRLASGCLEAASPAPGVFATPTPTPAAQNPGTAYCLFRFGVVLAANEVAHTLWPYLPQADAYELGIAQRLYSLLAE